MNNDENEVDIVESTDQLGVYDYDDDGDFDFNECFNELIESEAEKRLKEHF